MIYALKDVKKQRSRRRTTSPPKMYQYIKLICDFLKQKMCRVKLNDVLSEIDTMEQYEGIT